MRSQEGKGRGLWEAMPIGLSATTRGTAENTKTYQSENNGQPNQRRLSQINPPPHIKSAR